MSTQLVDSLIITGYPQEDTTLIKQAGERITNARKIFGNLYRGDKKTSRKGDNIGKKLEEHTGVLIMNRKEDVNLLIRLVVRAHCQGVQE